MRYEDELGVALAPSRRYGPRAPQVDGVDRWTGIIVCDLAWPDGSVGRYWRVLRRDANVTQLEFIA